MEIMLVVCSVNDIDISLNLFGFQKVCVWTDNEERHTENNQPIVATDTTTKMSNVFEPRIQEILSFTLLRWHTTTNHKLID